MLKELLHEAYDSAFKRPPLPTLSFAVSQPSHIAASQQSTQQAYQRLPQTPQTQHPAHDPLSFAAMGHGAMDKSHYPSFEDDVKDVRHRHRSHKAHFTQQPQQGNSMQIQSNPTVSQATTFPSGPSLFDPAFHRPAIVAGDTYQTPDQSQAVESHRDSDDENFREILNDLEVSEGDLFRKYTDF